MVVHVWGEAENSLPGRFADVPSRNESWAGGGERLLSAGACSGLWAWTHLDFGRVVLGFFSIRIIS